MDLASDTAWDIYAIFDSDEQDVGSMGDGEVHGKEHAIDGCLPMRWTIRPYE